MRSPFLLALALTCAACGTTAGRRAPPASAGIAARPAGASALQREATVAWQRRADPGQLERALELWRQALARRPGDVDLLVAVARGEAARARSLAAIPGESARAYAEGARAAEQALLATAPGLAGELALGAGTQQAVAGLPADAVAPAYWYAVDLEGYALAAGLTATLQLGRRVEVFLSLVLGQDEAFEGGGAHRALGTLYARAPAVAGGDLAKARTHFERAMAVAPGSLANRVAFAEDYAVAAQDRELFTRLLSEVVAATAKPAAEGVEGSVDRALLTERARNLLGRADELF